MAYVRTVKTASGATAVQIVWSTRGGRRSIEHIGSGHDDEDVEALKAAARQRLLQGQTTLDLNVETAGSGTGPLEIVASRATHLWDALCRCYDSLGFDAAVDGDTVFRDLVLARIIEPVSKQDSLRVLDEAGIKPPSYATIKRRLPNYATTELRQALSSKCAAYANVGPASLVLYDVSTLYFETDTGDGFREPGFSKERRLEPQITIGLLTDASGFPLAVEAFEGNKAETQTMIPVIKAFMKAYRLADVTVVADAGMVSEANQLEIAKAGLTYIIGARIPFLPSVIADWRSKHPNDDIPDGQIFTQPWPATDSEKTRGIPDRVTHYQYRLGRAKRTLAGIDEQVAKAEAAVEGKAPVKRNRFIQLTGATKSVNTNLVEKTKSLAGWKGYITNLTSDDASFVIGAYHQLWHVEKSFRMSKSDLQARPIYHRKRESIDAHMAIVFAALAVSHRIEQRTGWSIRKFVHTARRYRTITIRAGSQTLTAADPLPDDLRTALAEISEPDIAH